MPETWNPVPFPSPIDIDTNTELGKTYAKCNSQTCTDSQISLQDAKYKAVASCTVVGQREGTRNAWAITAATLATAAAACLTIAVTASATAVIPFFGWLVVSAAWIAFGIAALASSIASGTLIGAQLELDQANRDFVQAQLDFKASADAVMHDCPSQCWGDLTMPTC